MQKPDNDGDVGIEKLGNGEVLSTRCCLISLSSLSVCFAANLSPSNLSNDVSFSPSPIHT